MRSSWMLLGVVLVTLAGVARAQQDSPGETDDQAAMATDAGAGSCGEGDCHARHGGWYAGADATFLKVTRRGPTAVDITSDNGAVDSSDFTSMFGVGPRVWVGVELPCEWGVRGSFWRFKDESSGVLGNPGLDSTVASGDYFAAGSYTLDAYTIDLELTKHWHPDCNWLLETTIGARYGSLRHDETLAYYENSEGTTAFGSASREIQGIGVTASLDSRRFLGGGWDLFGNLRGSVLWGSTSGQATAAASDPTSGGFTTFDAPLGGNDVLGIAEAQVGVEWTHQLTCMRGTVFARGAFEYQYWTSTNTTAGVATASLSNAVTTTVTSTTPSGRVEMTGISVAVGFTY